VIPVLDGYHLVVPASMREALDALASTAGARPFAGGTDLMVLLEAGMLPPGSYVSLSRCRELRGIDQTVNGVAIGAMTTYSDIRRSDLLRRDYAVGCWAETCGVAP
jgi:carbon-monoxide dehydrogenase medium subunit